MPVGDAIREAMSVLAEHNIITGTLVPAPDLNITDKFIGLMWLALAWYFAVVLFVMAWYFVVDWNSGRKGVGGEMKVLKKAIPKSVGQVGSVDGKP